MTLLLAPVASGPVTRNTVHHCGVMTLLRALPDESVNCVVTSPPYFGLRDYGTSGQIGLEPTPAAFVATMVAVFREVRRVLRSDGTAWVNLGDSYGSGEVGRHDQKSGKFFTGSTSGKGYDEPRQYHRVPGLQPKNLLGIPWRVAFALQDDGWILRSDIIWAKPNPMPESVTDRPTKSHEYVFLLTKSPRYAYDADAIREASINDGKIVTLGEKSLSKGQAYGANVLPSGNGKANSVTVLPFRNRRSVWTIPTESFPGNHFATFPRKLIEPMILAGCPARTCAVCGAPWIRVTELLPTLNRTTRNGDGNGQLGHYGRFGDSQRASLGFRPTCDCHAETRPGLVLDPFMGSGTTGLVARDNGRDYIGCDLNAEYVALARERLSAPYTPPLFDTPALTVKAEQLSLMEVD